MGKTGFPSEAGQLRERARECSRLSPQERADILVELLRLERELLRSSPDREAKLRHIREEEARAREAFLRLVRRARGRR